MKLLLCLVAALPLVAQTLSSPLAGVVLNGHGRLVGLRGVLSNLLPGTPLAVPAEMTGQPLLGLAFSGSIGAVKLESEVLVLDTTGAIASRIPAFGGPALFSFDAQGASLRWMYYQMNNTLQSATGTTVFSAVAKGDAVIALGVVSGSFLPLLAITGDQLWAENIDTSSGAILSRVAIPGAAPAVYFEDGWLVASDGGLTWQAASGSQPSQQIDIPAPVKTLQPSGLHSVAINGQWLLTGKWQVLEIPVTPGAATVRQREQYQ